MSIDCTVSEASPESHPARRAPDPSAGAAPPQADVHDGCTEVRICGKNIKVPATRVGDVTVVVNGRLLKIASVKDDLFLATDPIHDPGLFVSHLKRHGPRAHVFTFSQRLPDVTPRYRYHLDWDNVAAVSTTDFDAWWNALPQESRKNTRRAEKRGVSVKRVALDDELVRGIVEIYNEGALRQGKPFYHYGKTFETVKKELATFAETSEFLGAYVNQQLVGFIKLVYMGSLASIMHIVSLQAHVDKRPTNALLTAAVAHCNKKGMSHLIYGSYTYGRKTNSTLAEFKRRNGFEQLLIPRYHIPLTLAGRLIVALRLYRGVIGILPPTLLSVLLAIRAKALEGLVAIRRLGRVRPTAPSEAS